MSEPVDDVAGVVRLEDAGEECAAVREAAAFDPAEFDAWLAENMAGIVAAFGREPCRGEAEALFEVWRFM